MSIVIFRDDDVLYVSEGDSFIGENEILTYFLVYFHNNFFCHFR